MSQDYPPHDDQETRRRPDRTTPRQPAGPMARPVFPHSDRTAMHRSAPGEPLPPEPETSPLYVPWWGFVLVILAVAGITCGLWGVVLMNRGEASTSVGPTPTPIFVVITATPTLGAGPLVVTTTPPPILISPAASEAVTAAPKTTAPPGYTPPSGTRIPISIGAVIVVIGTQGQGLNVRQGPGTDYAVNFLANDNDRFLVKDGPRQAQGYTWWYIIDPADQNRFGWAIEDNMQVVP